MDSAADAWRHGKKNGDDLEGEDNSPEMPGAPPRQRPSSSRITPSQGDKNAPHRLTEVGDVFKTKRLDTPLDKLTRAKGGKRSTTRTERKRGRYIKARPARDRLDDIAFDATFRQAALQQVHRQRDDVAFAVERQDLQRKVRVRRASNLILFVVDASLVDGGGRAHGSHQRRGDVAAGRCLPAAGSGGAGGVPERPGEGGAAPDLAVWNSPRRLCEMCRWAARRPFLPVC